MVGRWNVERYRTDRREEGSELVWMPKMHGMVEDWGGDLIEDEGGQADGGGGRRMMELVYDLAEDLIRHVEEGGRKCRLRKSDIGRSYLRRKESGELFGQGTIPKSATHAGRQTTCRYVLIHTEEALMNTKGPWPFPPPSTLSFKPARSPRLPQTPSLPSSRSHRNRMISSSAARSKALSLDTSMATAAGWERPGIVERPRKGVDRR
jgi:hypothetical protein